jgi:hypothetical protein
MFSAFDAGRSAEGGGQVSLAELAVDLGDFVRSFPTGEITVTLLAAPPNAHEAAGPRNSLPTAAVIDPALVGSKGTRPALPNNNRSLVDVSLIGVITGCCPGMSGRSKNDRSPGTFGQQMYGSQQPSQFNEVTRDPTISLVGNTDGQRRRGGCAFTRGSFSFGMSSVSQQDM